MKALEIRKMPKKIFFGKDYMVITVSIAERYRILYSDITWAYVKTGGEKPGEDREPKLWEITEDTEGELILYGGRPFKWIIQTDKMGRKAGALLKELCLHAPYIAAGGQDWFDPSGEADFGMVEKMVSIMLECSKS